MSRIVVGVGDLSAHSAETSTALSWAVAESAGSGRSLVVCYACRPDSALAAAGAVVRMALLELVEPALARAIAAARLRLGGDRVTVMVRAEAPEDLLVTTAGPADLLVVGAPARPGWLGRRSTTHEVVRRATCPVITVPSAVETVGENGSFRGHVAVGVDGSSHARAALEFAFAYAAEHNRPLVAITVISGTVIESWYPDEEHPPILGGAPAGLDLLAVEVEPWQFKYPDVEVERAVLAGPTLEGLVRGARGAAILVVGSRGLGPIRQALLGSVSHGAIDRSTCPVAVVHGDQRRA